MAHEKSCLLRGKSVFALVYVRSVLRAMVANWANVSDDDARDKRIFKIDGIVHSDTLNTVMASLEVVVTQIRHCGLRAVATLQTIIALEAVVTSLVLGNWARDSDTQVSCVVTWRGRSVVVVEIDASFFNELDFANNRSRRPRSASAKESFAECTLSICGSSSRVNFDVDSVVLNNNSSGVLSWDFFDIRPAPESSGARQASFVLSVRYSPMISIVLSLDNKRANWAEFRLRCSFRAMPEVVGCMTVAYRGSNGSTSIAEGTCRANLALFSFNY